MNQHKLKSVIVAFLCLSLLAGCPRNVESHYSWKQGTNANGSQIWLERADRAFCYFTSVSGSFRGFGDHLELSVQTNPSTGTQDWVLFGSWGGDHQIAADVDCSFYTNYDFPYPQASSNTGRVGPVCTTSSMFENNVCCGWTTGGQYNPNIPYNPGYCAGDPVSSGSCGGGQVSHTSCQNKKGEDIEWLSPMPTFCYLSKMQGEFNGAGEGIAVVKPFDPSNEWALFTSSQTDQSNDSGVLGGGTCISYSTPIARVINGQGGVTSAQGDLTTFSWSQDQASPTTTMIPADQGVCFLTGVGGNFRGNGEAVQIVNRDNYLQLTGRSGQDHVHGEARCVRYAVQPTS